MIIRDTLLLTRPHSLFDEQNFAAFSRPHSWA